MFETVHSARLGLINKFFKLEKLNEIFFIGNLLLYIILILA